MSTTESFVDDVIICRKYGAYKTALTTINWALAFFGNVLTIWTMASTKERIGTKGRAYIVCLSCFDLLMAPVLVVDMALGWTGGSVPADVPAFQCRATKLGACADQEQDGYRLILLHFARWFSAHHVCCVC
jgi:hypothetical protein